MKETRNTEQLTELIKDSRKVYGYAIVFNSESRDLGGFTEIIDPSAIEGVLEKSDILALLNHNEDRGVLARSKYGKGSLTLEVDDIGLRYEFDAPNTQLGDELLEGLRRGDISTSSFAFTVADDKWEKRSNGKFLRTITKFKELFDVSPVYKEAYENTSVALRKMQEMEENTQVEEPATEEQTEQEVPTSEPVTQTTDEVRNTNENNTKQIIMKKFSLIKTINDVVNNRSLDEYAQAVVEEGMNELRKAGLNFSGSIQLPVMETRDNEFTVTVDGTYTVETEKLNILEPLRANMVLSQAGATFLTGLVGNIDIPSYSGSTVGWKGEIVSADNGKGTFDNKSFSPKRLTAYIDISKQFLNQDCVAAEEMLKRDIINAIGDKLEATILGNEAGTTVKPAGIFYNVSAKEVTYGELVDMEVTLEEANVKGNFKFIGNPAFKGLCKVNTVSGQKSDLRTIMDGSNEVNGYPVLTTSNSKGFAFGNWSDLVICQWGALDLVVDPYTLAKEGMVRLVVNAYFDAGFRRDGAVVPYTIQEDTITE